MRHVSLPLVIVCVCLCLLCSCTSQAPSGKKAGPGPIEEMQSEAPVKIEGEWIKSTTEQLETGKKVIFVNSLDEHFRQEVVEDEEGRVIRRTLLNEFGPLKTTDFYENGLVKSETTYEGGRIVKNVAYFPDTKIREESNLQPDKTKIIHTWNEEGQLVQEDVLDEKNKYISAKRWYADGVLQYEASFNKGAPLMRTWYKPDGTVEKRVKGSRG